MKMNGIRNSRFFWFLKNICALGRCDIYKDLAELKSQQVLCSQKLSNLDDKLFVLEVLSYYETHKEESFSYGEELSFLQNERFDIFPYPFIHNKISVEIGIEDKIKLPYVLHKGKRLYMPLEYDKKRVEVVYRRLVEKESITSDGCLSKSPHQYQSDTFKIEEGDVLVDVGCAEALLSLDVIDKVKKVYLIESDLRWFPALKTTFAPYRDKVVLVNKLVADTDSDTTITLATLLKEEQNSPLFIKMDIEGYETQVIGASKDFLENHPKVKVACCTYHKANDAETLEKIFQSYGYEITFSDGYMLFRPDSLTPPYFRKGVIRAQKKK